ncbi:hypothetical protein SAMN02745117_02617 [Lampropedia hyalina DSM 16112]|uniref:Integrase DNA-binding domain-containing protein n=1 Tax=Lampropedia hyalina DSM 16112 TaxID=1122156 RepID=A0A1M5ELD2_9BURK|nr:Arm DNA-binding domain-containing protein [Lampropedia hyalina]SHF80098.1 hypothetical protein SAMN02745117_02617 [Lampropedia hyalina DSM 16112]
MPLSDVALRQAKPQDKPYKLTDGTGLFLLVNHVGKYWRFNYRFEGKQKTASYGVYPVLWSSFSGHRDKAFQVLAFSY